MPDISKITLPSGNTYDLKDATARAAIEALEGASYFLGITTTVLSDGSHASPIVINGESVYPKNGNITIFENSEFIWCGKNKYPIDVIKIQTVSGGLQLKRDTAGVPLNIYVHELSDYDPLFTFAQGSTTSNVSSTYSQVDLDPDWLYIQSGSNYVQVLDSDTDSRTYVIGGSMVYDDYIWAQFGDLSSLGNLAYFDNITVTKGSGDQVLGEDTTFINSTSAVSFAAHTTKSALGASATFSTGIVLNKASIGAIASGTAVSTTASDDFIKSCTPTTKTIEFSVANEVLTVGGTGFPTSSNTFTGVTGISTTTGNAIGSVSISQQPIITMQTGVDPQHSVEVAVGVTRIETTVDNADSVAAITALGAGTAAAQTITVGATDKVKIIKYNDLEVEATN